MMTNMNCIILILIVAISIEHVGADTIANYGALDLPLPFNDMDKWLDEMNRHQPHPEYKIHPIKQSVEL